MGMVCPIKINMSKALLIDVGGTNMRYALASIEKDDLSNSNKIIFESDNFEEIISDLIKNNNVDTLIISIAGPKINDHSIKMSKIDFTFDASKLKSKFNLKNCILLNDWEAIAHSYSFIKDEIDYIKTGEKFNEKVFFLGPGTGLGASLLVNKDLVIPTEIGVTSNMSLKMQKNYNIQTDDNFLLEDFISGSAISNIYKLKKNINLTSEEIYKKYKEKDSTAIEVIEGFIRCLAESLTDFAVTFIPGNGILLAGSLIRTIYPNINKDEFCDLFMKSHYDVHKLMLDKISIGIITKEKTPLYGNLNLYKKINN